MSDLSTTAERTRRAILTAGVEVLGCNPGASLADVAARASVSRSTLHRYFPDRAALRQALDDLTVSEWSSAVRRARLDEGTGLEAFRRLCTELMDSLGILMWWMNESADQSEDDGCTEEDAAIAAAIERGQGDGTIDTRVSYTWINNLLWATLYAVQYAPATSGHHVLSPFEARRQGLYTLLKCVAADPRAV